MLKLKNIKKTYISGDEKVEALKGINIEFRKSEFVSILGQSGCGKTTLLNIIGGLDRYTSGDLVINGKSTKDFKDRDWDAYRNYSVGFVFQSYNLIGHQTVLSNVELALTISGVSRKERKQRAIKALEEVGLKEQIHKKPNQLSGGQMQRVAIARALVNNPDIILADEPTGALDTKTSVQVMEILKKISKDKLIIMVTHNPELAEKYSSLLNYFERNFYASAPNREDTEKFITHATAQLDSLLRYTGVKNILCNRRNSRNFDNTLKNADVTLVCTRRGDLGPNIHTAFGLFCILMMQYSVLRRPGTEKDRVPHFLYIDEFADFVGNSTDSLFTLYRKYKVSTIISIQNLGQLDKGTNKKHRQIITANCSNKFVFGNNTPEDNEWWSKEIGEKKEWSFGSSYDTAKGEYDPKLTGIKYENKIKYQPGKIQALKFKQAMYKIRNLGGKSDNGTVNLNFLSATYYEPKPSKEYPFERYNSGFDSHSAEDKYEDEKETKRKNKTEE